MSYGRLLFNESEVGKLAKAIDWDNHQLGPVDQWSQSLSTALSIVFNSLFPMFISWGEKRHFFYNDAYALILGDKHPKAFGDQFPNIWSEIWKDIEPLIHKVDQGESVYLENLQLFMNRHGYEEETYFTFSYSPIRGTNGEVQGLFCACVETTLQIKSERELKKSLETRDEFLSVASHELKTPLTSLQLQSQLFKRKVERSNDSAPIPTASVIRFASEAEKQVNRLNRLVDDMLDVSRIRTGKMKIIKERFDLCEAVKEVLSRMETQIRWANYELPVIQACESVFGNWDRLRIEQVVGNLISNALRYGEGKLVEIRVEPRQGLARLQVKDKGIGIHKSDQESIFNRYHRVPNTDVSNGLGLGLYLAKQIIEAHDGRIWVESEKGMGSNFLIELPVE